MKNPVHTYTFQTSHPLTQTQIDKINQLITFDLPSEHPDFEDVPEWTTQIKLESVEELIDLIIRGELFF